MTLVFRCPPEWRGLLPPPVPARAMLPDWLRAMPPTAQSDLLGRDIRTVKQCPPFLDVMSFGWLIRLAADVRVERGSFAWDWDLPPSALEEAPRAPMGLHLSAQTTGAPFHAEGSAVVKFMNPWTIETPPGQALLVVHPLNRPDLPFRTLAGVVDADGFSHGLVHFPALWTAADFAGVLAAGTPVAQVLAVPRDQSGLLATLDGEDAAAFRRTTATISAAPAGYRKAFRARDRE
ncbi:MAG: hypothetical protein AAFX81_03990 [Pseudomonadota bacterium]